MWMSPPLMSNEVHFAPPSLERFCWFTLATQIDFGFDGSNAGWCVMWARPFIPHSHVFPPSFDRPSDCPTLAQSMLLLGCSTMCSTTSLLSSAPESCQLFPPSTLPQMPPPWVAAQR